MRLLWICVGLGILNSLMACSTARSSKKPVLIAPQSVDTSAVVKIDTVPAVRIDTIGVAVDTTFSDSAFDIAEDKPLTPAEKVALQKTTGLFRHADFAPAIHYDLRKPNFVILHHTSQNSVAQTVRTFQLDHTQVSAHYIVGKEGEIIQMLNDYDRAWHAGRSKWGAVTDLNSVSIGIELDNNGREPFPEVQIGSLLQLLDTLKTKYQIPQVNFLAHGDVAPGRKNDPNSFFPWKRLAERGFGIWYNEDYLLEPPLNFNPFDALKIMGYDMSKPESAIRAFKRKFIGDDRDATLSPRDIAVLYDLYRKYY